MGLGYKGKGTAKKNTVGVFGVKQSAQNGKGSVISSTFGDGWLKSAEERLAKRQFPCSNCGVMKPEGHCVKCNYTPKGNRGW